MRKNLSLALFAMTTLMFTLAIASAHVSYYDHYHYYPSSDYYSSSSREVNTYYNSWGRGSSREIREETTTIQRDGYGYNSESSSSYYSYSSNSYSRPGDYDNVYPTNFRFSYMHPDYSDRNSYSDNYYSPRYDWHLGYYNWRY